MRRILPPVALSGAARVWATIAGSGSTPPARLSTRKRGRWRSCSTASSGPESMPVRSPLAALTARGKTATGGLPADRRDRQPAPRG
ncbi:hypothetical protein LN650_23645 [Klebsiella pneumoniae subsp. pneumoniae]|nr:hypothetical protein [Klebsiella pneumoniae subsp. pneumoniae]